MRIASFNANGLRAAARRGFFDWFAAAGIDVLAVQETKACEDQLLEPPFLPEGYHRSLHDARCRRGYSGAAIYANRPPDSVHTTLGHAVFDAEGRYLEARFGALSVVSLYLPSGSSLESRQVFKYEVLDFLTPILERWRRSRRSYVLCGDFNIVRGPLDIRNWRSNQKNSGCLPAERDWLNRMVTGGWVDTYRSLHPTGESYTWWSQRGQARANNVGWRIDYQLASPRLGKRLQSCEIAADPQFSDHAPFLVDYDLA